MDDVVVGGLLRGRVDESNMTDDTNAVSEAFAALGDETRVAILEALVDARREDPENAALSFSDLRERVGVQDSGRFNYHLGKLRGQFLEETDGAYELTYAGREVVGAILAGTYDATVELDPVVLDDECLTCASELEARYGDGELTVGCDNDHMVMRTTVPPVAATERTMQDLLSVAARSTYADFERLAAGLCVECHGHLDRDIRAVEETDVIDHVYRTTCDRCGFVTPSAAGVVVLREPAFVAFCHDHGIDVREHLPWTLPVLTDGETVRTSEDPPRYEVRVTADDERFRATIDDSGEVLATERMDV